MEKCQQFGIFILPYWLLRPGCEDARGINCADQWSDSDSNISAKREYDLNRWAVCIHDALMEDVLPKRSRGLSMLKDSDNCGYSFLYSTARDLHPAFVPDATKLMGDFPTQGENENFDDWKRRVDFHRAMAAFVDDIEMDLGEELTKNKYINHLQNHRAITSQVEQERASPAKKDVENYKKGNFITHLRTLDDKFSRRSLSHSSSSSSLSRSDSFRSDSLRSDSRRSDSRRSDSH